MTAKERRARINLIVSVGLAVAALVFFSIVNREPETVPAPELTSTTPAAEPAPAPNPAPVSGQTVQDLPPDLQQALQSAPPPMPADLKAQLEAAPPELPEDLRKQLEGPPPTLPPELEAQLKAPPPELPEDMKRALQIPPRVVSIEEVNTPPDPGR